jgi:hypothetical protein
MVNQELHKILPERISISTIDIAHQAAYLAR